LTLFDLLTSTSPPVLRDTGNRRINLWLSRVLYC